MTVARPSLLPLGSAALLSVSLASPAAASEARFAGDDVRVTVDDAGLARVEHDVAFRAAAGLKAFELNGIEPEAALDPLAPVLVEGATVASGRVERKGDRALRVIVDPLPRADRQKGSLLVTVRVSYSVDLVRARELTPDGAMWLLAWTAPAAPEGFDSARVVLSLPAAPTEPKALSSDGTDLDDGRIVTLHRSPLKDDLEMSRPHVARGEASTWTARVDPRAFPGIHDPSMRPAPVAPPPAPPTSRWLPWIVAAIAGLAFAALARAKLRSFAQACEAHGLAPRGLFGPLPAWARASLAGASLAGAIALQALERPLPGAALVALAMALVASRPPEARRSPRGPGQWLALSPAEAFAAERARDLLDPATTAGKCSALLLAAASVALGLALRSVDMAWTWLAPLDALALLPLLFTGSRAQLPPDRARAPRGRLAPLYRAFKRDDSLRVAPWGRVPTGAAAADELRLLVLPRAPIAGVVGIEVGVAWHPTPAGYAPETEVLVRVRDESAAAARLALLAPQARARAVPGRRPDERVFRLLPAIASRRGAVALVRRLARELHDRRKSLPGVSWRGAERRLPPNERLRTASPARVAAPTGKLEAIAKGAPALAASL